MILQRRRSPKLNLLELEVFFLLLTSSSPPERDGRRINYIFSCEYFFPTTFVTPKKLMEISSYPSFSSQNAKPGKGLIFFYLLQPFTEINFTIWKLCATISNIVVQLFNQTLYEKRPRVRKNRPWNEEKNSYRNVQTHSIKLLKSFCIHIQIKVHDGRREFAMGKEAKEKSRWNN